MLNSSRGCIGRRWVGCGSNAGSDSGSYRRSGLFSDGVAVGAVPTWAEDGGLGKAGSCTALPQTTCHQEGRLAEGAAGCYLTLCRKTCCMVVEVNKTCF